MSDLPKNDCKGPAEHWLHICQLRKDGKKDEVTELMADPGFICLNCNAVARYAKNLCNPSPFSKV